MTSRPIDTEDLKARLTDEQFEVTQNKGTERPFTGKYVDHKADGSYCCVCCNAALFRSDAKFHSGCGWPSFFQPLPDANLREIEDLSHGMRRVEVRCSRCDAHLGHVFPDGPPPTGLRFCINSASLDLEADDG